MSDNMNKNKDAVKKGAETTKKVMNGVKKAAKKLMSAIKKIINVIKLLLKIPYGWIVLLVIVIVLAIILLIIIITFLIALGKYERDIKSGGPGISTTEDYETIIGAIGYGGYDTLIPEEKSIEYLAFEYAVLMDVAEYMHENQDYLTNKMVNGKNYKTSAVFPEGIVNTSYNAKNISKEEWQNYVVEAQGGSAPTEEKFSSISGGDSILGGNREVVTPRLIYETMVGENENDASLMPYLVVVREDFKLNYFLQGLDDRVWKSYENLEEIKSGDLAAVKNKIEPVRYSTQLNRYNIEMPNSAYKQDLEDALEKTNEAFGVEDPNTFIKADQEDKGYDSEIYYTESETNIVYKIPLKLLIGRYLPKATLLSTWYSLKDPSDYDIDELMENIKDIYNAACYESTSASIPTIQITDKIDEKTGKVTRTQSKYIGGTAKEEYKKDTINGKEIKYATTNKRTFIYFEQYGLETSRYESYKAYRETSKDESNPNPISPVATYLTKERANFIQSLNLKLSGIEYSIYNDDGERIIVTGDKNVSLKPTYSFIEDPDLDEKLKSKYLFGEEINITQEKPIYPFMGKVVQRAEEIFIANGNNIRIKKEDSNRDDGAIIYDHNVINKFYLKAEPGNEKQKDLYRLPEDFRYYNQDDQMPHWYDLKGDEKNKDSKNIKEELEKAYLEAFQEVYKDPNYSGDIIAMLRAETGLDIVGYNENGADYATGENVSYYKMAVYVVEEKTLQMRQTIYHTRMPVLLVKYCDTWAKTIEYNNIIKQNSIDYRNYKYLIPNSLTSLGFANMQLEETAKYRTTAYKDYFNSANGKGKEGIKEADVLNMLMHWEDLGNSGGDESTYAFMRDLYKLAVYIRDYEKTMLEGAYNYLYIPSTISNFEDETIQKIFWLERLGVSKGEDELSQTEQSKIRTKAIDTKWQNLEYDEYYECVYNVTDGEEANVYALFPFGAPCIRTYYMLKNWDEIISQKFKENAHPAVDMCSRYYIKQILAAKDYPSSASVESKIYFYELNRLTLAYMNNGNRREDAFILAERTLNSTLEEYSLNSPVVAIAPGYVEQVNYDARSGFYVTIRHNTKEKNAQAQITSFYAHLKRWPLVEVGETVGAGTILGYEGTTGRSTGNHLHFELVVNGEIVDPKEYLTPVFSPFYYDEKAKAVLDEDKDRALGSEYYTLERTVLLDNGLYNNNNVINGMTLQNGKKVEFNIGNKEKAYNSGDSYNLSPYNVKWGNNVPEKELANTLDKIMDLNLLNQAIGFKSGEKESNTTQILKYEDDVTADPMFFETKTDSYKKKLTWPKWFAEEMAEYKSELVVDNYNGPRSPSDEITEEGMNELIRMQNSLKEMGYYQLAGIDFKDAGYGRYSEQFVTVIKTMKKDLINKGYDIYGISAIDGNLDENTISAYNTMIQYTIEENQFTMAQKTTYNASTNLSIEPGLAIAIARVEGEAGNKFLALKEKGSDKGIMQIDFNLAKERFKEKGIGSEDAKTLAKQPLRNTNIGMEVLKEYMKELYEKYGKNINTAKNNIVFRGQTSGYWYEVYNDSKTYSKRWCDGENIDRLMLYALALEAYDKGGVENISFETVSAILSGNLTAYPQNVLKEFKTLMLEEAKADK